MSSRREREVLEKLERFDSIILSVSKKWSGRSRLYGTEDLIQEASIVLWRCVLEYPSLKEQELVKVFQTSLRHRLISLHRVRHVKDTERTRSLHGISDDDAEDYGSGRIESFIDLRRAVFPGYPVTPWGFYEESLSKLERRIGSKKFRRLCQGARQGRNFKTQKKIVLKEADFL